MNAGIVIVKKGKSSSIVTQREANEVMFFEDIRREHKLISVMKMIST